MKPRKTGRHRHKRADIFGSWLLHQTRRDEHGHVGSDADTERAPYHIEVVTNLQFSNGCANVQKAHTRDPYTTMMSQDEPLHDALRTEPSPQLDISEFVNKLRRDRVSS